MDRSQGMIMNKYIAVAVAFMGVWFYELSGGSDFEPGEHSLVIFAAPKPTEPQKPQGIGLVARAETTVPLTEVLPARAPVPKEPRPSITSEVTEGLSLVKLTTPAPEPTPELEVEPETPEVIEIVQEPEPQTPAPDLRFVDGDRVNMRGGPGTDYAVVGKLVRNDMVEVLKDEGNGWLHLRDIATGQEGWMADWLVTASN